MARDKITVDLLLQTKQAEREIARLNRKIAEVGKGLGKTFGGGAGGGDKVRALGTGLSKATVKADEFNKSLEASNARVIAFGASAGLIMGIDRALKAMVASAIKVEKAMLDVNVVMNVSNKQMQEFGKGMFKVAKDTAQSFDTVAEAAVELARQGLGMERTLTRAKDALILTRLTGMNAADAVKNLTAAVNSFNKEGVTSAQVINRMAKVDAAFAVSSDDLAKSISRVGASAVSAGVSMNELMAITTSVQQRTARGGAVIGNAFKTIFTRLQRKDVLQNLRNLGVAVTDNNGVMLSGIQVLQNLANNFDNLSKATQSSTAEQVAGVFQVNILKAALADLSSQTSDYGRALRTANQATDEAYQRNEQLNQSLDALINKTLANLTAAGAGLGGALEPALRNILGTVNNVIEAFGKGGTFEDFGKTWGKGIISGLGSFIGGPGLLLVTAVFGKLALSLGRFAGKAIQDVLGINEATKQRAALEEAVVALIASEPTLLQKVKTGTMSILQVEKDILATVKLANYERARIQAYAGPVTGRLMSSGMGVGPKGATMGRAGGFVPNFANAGAERMAAAAGGYRAGTIKTMNQPGAGAVMYNSAETVKRFPGMKQSAIMPPQGSPAGAGYKAAFGSAHGFDPYAGGGFVPNFMALYQMAGRQVTGAGMAAGLKSGKISPAAATAAGYAKGQSKRKTGPKEHVYPASHLGVLGIEGTHTGNASTTFGQLARFKSFPAHLKKQKVTFAGMQMRTINAAKKNLTVQSFSNKISQLMTDPVAKLAHNIFGKSLGNDWGASVSGLKSKWGGKKQLLPPGAEGSIFEAAVNLGLKATRGGATLAKTFDQGIGGSQKPFDFEEKGRAKPPFKKAFGFGANLQLADAKRSINHENVRTIIKKAYNQKPPLKGLPIPSGLGFVPNFVMGTGAADPGGPAGFFPRGNPQNILDAVEASREKSLDQEGKPSAKAIEKQFKGAGPKWKDNFVGPKGMGWPGLWYPSRNPGFKVGDYPDWESLSKSTATPMGVDLTGRQLSIMRNQFVSVFGHPEESGHKRGAGQQVGSEGSYSFKKNWLKLSAKRAMSLYEGGGSGRGALANELTHLIQDRFLVGKDLHGTKGRDGKHWGLAAETGSFRGKLLKSSREMDEEWVARGKPLADGDRRYIISGDLGNFGSAPAPPGGGGGWKPGMGIPGPRKRHDTSVPGLHDEWKRWHGATTEERINALKTGKDKYGNPIPDVGRMLIEWQSTLSSYLLKDKDRASQGFAQGYIPNYSPLSSAIGREMQGGVPASAIRVGSNAALRSAGNPGGMGVYNTRDEPRGLGQGISRARSQGMNPKGHGVPNFLVKPAPMPSTTSPMKAARFVAPSVLGPPPAGAPGRHTGPPVIGASPASRLGLGGVAKGMDAAGKAAKDAAKASTEATKQTRKMGAAMGGMMVQMAMGGIAANMEEGVGQTSVKGVGGIAGYAGMGMMMGGPWGAAAGAAIGGLQMGAEMLTKHTDAAKQSFEALSKELQKAQQDGARVSETIGKLSSALGNLGQESDPTKREAEARKVASHLTQLVSDLPAGSDARKAIQAQKKKLSSGVLPTMAELNQVAKDAEIENTKHQRSLGLNVAGAGAKQLSGNESSWWTGYMPQEISQEWGESKGRFIDALTMQGPTLMQPKRAAESALQGLGLRDKLPKWMQGETYQEEIIREAGERRQGRAAEKVPGFYKAFMGTKTIGPTGQLTDTSIGEALQQSPEAMAIIAKLRTATGGRGGTQGKNIDIWKKSPAMGAGGMFDTLMEQALAAADVKDDMAAALKEQMNTPENRIAFLNTMVGRGVQGLDTGYFDFSSDVKGIKGDPLGAAYSAETQKENEAIAKAVAGAPLPTKPVRAPTGIKETRAFAEGLRKASVAASNSLKETQLRIAGSAKVRALETKYEMALAGATKDTLGVADAKLAQALKTAANNFEDASEIARGTFDANFKKDMSSTAGKFEKFVQGENFFQGQWSNQFSGVYSTGKIPQIDVARNTFKGLLEDYTGEGGAAALEEKIIGVREKKETETTLGVEDKVIDQFGDEVLEKLRARTETLDQKMKELGIQHVNAQDHAKAQAAIDKKMLELSRKLNTEKAKEIRLTAVILGKQKVEEAARRRAEGQIGGKEYYSAEQDYLKAQIAERGIRPSDFGKGMETAFRGEMAYDTVDYFNELTDGSRELASTMKSSFADAFKSIASGANSVEGAIANMAQGILDSISNMSANMATNMLFSKMFPGKSQGGHISKFNSGGIVTGGSGYRDDVPAMMDGGEYVIKKSSAQKIGYGTLNAINSGNVRGYGGGGSTEGPGMGSMFAVSAGASAISGLLNSGKGSKKKPWRGKDYGFGRGKHGYFGGPDADAGRGSSFAGGSNAAQVSLNKAYVYYRRDPKTGRLISERARPTEGRYEVSSALSLAGRLGSEDPQTARMFGKETKMGSYTDYLFTETARRKAVLKAHERQKRGRLMSAYMNAAMLMGGSYLMGKTGPMTSELTGASVSAQGRKGFNALSASQRGGMSAKEWLDAGVNINDSGLPDMAAGGSTRGSSAAMLTGGEFVMGADTVREHGLGFMGELNRGNMTGMANGGPVGGVAGGGVAGGGVGSVNNNVSVNVNIDRRGNADVSASPETSTDNTGSENSTAEAQKNKELGVALQTVVLQEIMKQQRPGGLLQGKPHTP